MSDVVITCNRCGRSFVWSEGEQRYYKERGLHPPKRCEPCRAKHKNEFAAREQRRAARRGPKVYRIQSETERRWLLTLLFAGIAAVVVFVALLLLF